MQQLTILFTPTNGRIDGNHITGRGLHGLLFNVLQQVNPAEAAWLHHHESPKPFSLVPLYTEEGALAGMRLSAVTERAGILFLEAWQTMKEQGELLRLGRYQTFTASSITSTAGPSFQALAQSRPESTMSLHFLSPTAFKQGPGHLPLPVPANVFSWPWRVWQAFAPAALTLGDSWPDWCEANVFVCRHRIETVEVPISQQERFTGFVGTVEFEAMDGTEAYLRVWQALGSLATFCGVGHKTTMGMGAVERTAGLL